MQRIINARQPIFSMKIIYLLCFIAIILSGCILNQKDSQRIEFSAWKYNDVRLLDPADAAVPESDIIALYTRYDTHVIQIRVDFLDFDSSMEQDVYIPIDTNPGGLNLVKTSHDELIPVEINWDYLIFIPADGKIEIVNYRYNQIDDIVVWFIQNPVQDYFILSFPYDSIPAISPLSKIQVIATPPNQPVIVDRTEVIDFGAPPPACAKIIFLFWDIFYSSTPAETLRSWAGAHSGPTSGRHGLKYLLDFAEKSKYPIFLLDFNNPETLSAIDYLNATDWIEKLQSSENIYLDNFSLCMVNENMFFLLNRKYICGNNDYAHLLNKHNFCFSKTNNLVESTQFPEISLQCISRLISNGITQSSTPIIMGGDFQSSLLGDPAMLSYVSTYLKTHPWIHIFSRYEFLSSNAITIEDFLSMQIDSLDREAGYLQHQNSEPNPTYPSIHYEIAMAIAHAPQNKLTELAKQTLVTLTNPPKVDLLPLSSNYIGSIGHILSAADWIEKPSRISTCSIDLDYDGEIECILSNNQVFLTIEPDGGYIQFIFSKDENGAHQILGPTWEFMVGIADPSSWDLSKGLLSDPGQILGGFVENTNHGNYLAEIQANKIEFFDDNHRTLKSIMLSNNQIFFEYSGQNLPDQKVQVPIVLDPWVRFTENWGEKYIRRNASDGIRWGIESGISIELSSDSKIDFYPFNSTHYTFINPENPNFDYGRGHYLPFPMALAEIHSKEHYFVHIKINP